MSEGNHPSRPCLSEEEINNLLIAPQELPDLGTVESHLSQCSECVQRLELASVASANESVRKQLVPDSIGVQQNAADTIQIDPAGQETEPPFETDEESGEEAGYSLPSIAGYEIHEVLGRGGMGIVYRATHNELGRAVALKMISGGLLAGPEKIRRFGQEAQSLAKLDHPNIVKVFDVGAFQGQPYIAMELVPGQSLDQRLDGVPWTPERSASLVIKLARAMDAAHGQSIIHRDLKPANVLIVDDRQPLDEPKIIDFGLARDTDTSAITMTGDVFGSPSYMSPEQALGKQNETGTASDVYSLGSILYELLTGRPPFIGSTAAETLNQIINEDPVRPKLLNSAIPRDLETICLKCIEKPIDRRYLSASQLASDLQNYLDGKPITARPASPLEKAWKFGRRHPVWVAVGLVSFVAVSMMLVMWVKFTQDLAEQKNYALAQKAAAEKEEKRAVESELKAKANEELAKENERIALRNEKIAEDQVEIQKQTYLFTRTLLSKLKTFKKNDQLIELIVETERTFDDTYVDQPVMKAAYLASVAHTLLDLSEYEMALERIDRAIDAYEKERPDSIHNANAKILKILILMGMNRLSEAVQLRRTLDIEKVDIVRNDLLLLFLFDAKDLMDQRKYEEAEKFLLNVLEKENIDDSFRYQAFGLLGVIKSGAQKHDEAAEYFKEHLRLVEASGVASTQTLIRAKHRLAHSLVQTGKVKQALEDYDRILDECIEKFGQDHVLTIEVMINFALAHSSANQYASAKALNKKVAKLSIKKLGQRHRFSLNPIISFGRDATENNDSEQFLEFVNENLDLKKFSKRKDYYSVSLMVYVAKAHVELDQVDEAQEILNRTKEVAKQGKFPAGPMLKEIENLESKISNKTEDMAPAK